KSSRAVRMGPRSRPTTLSPALVSSRARIAPVHPTPMTTASVSLSIVVMGNSVSDCCERQTRCAPSPRLRGEGWGEGDSPRAQAAESPPHPLASLATSPRTRGEVESAARASLHSDSPQEKSMMERGGLSYFLPKYFLMSSRYVAGRP